MLVESRHCCQSVSNHHQLYLMLVVTRLWTPQSKSYLLHNVKLYVCLNVAPSNVSIHRTAAYQHVHKPVQSQVQTVHQTIAKKSVQKVATCPEQSSL